MSALLAALHLDSPDSLKRVLVTLLGGLCVLLVNPLLAAKGLPPVSDSTIAAFAGLLATFVLQSGANSAAGKLAAAKGAGDAAAAQVTPGGADKVLADIAGAGTPPPPVAPQ